MRQIISAKSMEEAYRLRRDLPEARYVSGGTEVLRLNGSVPDATALIDVSAFLSPEIEKKHDAIIIGAGATFQDIIDSPVIPLWLKEACGYMSSLALRMQATIGGNIARLGDDSYLIPVLLAAGARQAVTAIALSKSADESFSKAAFEIASAFGSAFLLDEALFPAFIGLSGSGIAFAMQFIHAMSMAGVEEGLPYPEALAIAADTMLSACSLLKQTKANPVELASRVCSAGGTTIKGMNALSANSFDHAVIEAVKAASLRSRELEHIALERKND